MPRRLSAARVKEKAFLHHVAHAADGYLRVDLVWHATVGEPPTVPFDASGITVRQVWYTSKDSTRAPMYLMYKSGLVPNAETPALLHGYGGFTVSLMPRFDARAALWVERMAVSPRRLHCVGGTNSARVGIRRAC